MLSLLSSSTPSCSSAAVSRPRFSPSSLLLSVSVAAVAQAAVPAPGKTERRLPLGNPTAAGIVVYLTLLASGGSVRDMVRVMKQFNEREERPPI